MRSPVGVAKFEHATLDKRAEVASLQAARIEIEEERQFGGGGPAADPEDFDDERPENVRERFVAERADAGP